MPPQSSGGAASFPSVPRGVGNVEFSRQDFLNGEHVFPGIAEVVDISRLRTLVQQIRKACLFFVEGERSVQEPLVWIRNAKPLLANIELMCA